MSFNNQYDETVSFGDWLGSLLLTIIPIVGIVLVFVWAFGGNTKTSKRNFFRAYLLISAITLALSVAAVIVFYSALLTSLGPAISGFYY